MFSYQLVTSKINKINLVRVEVMYKCRRFIGECNNPNNGAIIVFAHIMEAIINVTLSVLEGYREENFNLGKLQRSTL